MPFVKLDCGIIHSSLWSESSDTRICWITLLVLADAEGFVRAAPSAIAREAGIGSEQARKALELFSSPDDESRSPENKGKRIERVDGGFRILNYEKYRERDYTNAARQKRYRDKQRNTVTSVTGNVTTVTRNGASRKQKQSTEADKEKKAAKDKLSPQSVEEWLTELQASEAYKRLNVRALYAKMEQWCKIRNLHPTKRRFINWLNKEDIPLPNCNGTKPVYGRNYAPPPKEPTEAEQEKAREIARTETERLRKELNR